MLILAALFDGCAPVGSSQDGFAQYGRWQTYSSTQALHYPDFDLLFKADRGTVKHLEGLPLGTAYHFAISNLSTEVSVV